MKYKFVASNLHFDTSKLKKLKHKEILGVFIIDFDDSNREQIYNDIINALLPRDIILGNDINVIGDDGFVYIVNERGVSNPRKIPLYFPRVLAFNITRSKKNSKSAKYINSALKEHAKTEHISKPSLSEYKKGEFFDKENGLCFSYRVRPAKDKNKPVVLFYHGAGCIGKENFKQLYEFGVVRKKFSELDCTVILPQAPCISHSENSVARRYTDSVKKLVDRISTETEADKSRIYVFGTSFGGFCTWYSAWKNPDYFACAMPVMGCFWEAVLSNKYDLAKMKDVPMWVAHSSDDDNVVVESDDKCVARLKELGADIKYTRWDKYGHKMCNKFYRKENWIDWMFSQSLKNRKD